MTNWDVTKTGNMKNGNGDGEWGMGNKVLDVN